MHKKTKNYRIFFVTISRSNYVAESKNDNNCSLMKRIIKTGFRILVL